MIVHIEIKGNLDQSWSDWLGAVEISSMVRENGDLITTLTGDLPDQSALFGILDRIRDLNLILVSLTVHDEKSCCKMI